MCAPLEKPPKMTLSIYTIWKIPSTCCFHLHLSYSNDVADVPAAVATAATFVFYQCMILYKKLSFEELEQKLLFCDKLNYW